MPLGVAPSEDDAHLAVLAYAEGMRLMVHHPPLEGQLPGDERTRYALAAKAKRMGTLPGMPDLMVYDPTELIEGVRFVGCAIEMKRADRSETHVSDAQRERIAQLQTRGWLAGWCRGDAEAIAVLRLAYGGRRRRGAR